MGIAERKEREKQQMVELILDKAKQLFVEEGFEKVTIRRVAEAIEYSPRTIYLYFKDKEDILDAIRAAGYELFYERQQTVLKVSDPFERLQAQVQVYIEFGLEQPDYYYLMFIQRSSAISPYNQQSWQVGIKTFEFFKQNVAECLAAGEISGGSLEAVNFALWSLVHGMVSLIIRGRLEMFTTEKRDELVREACNFILSHLKAIPGSTMPTTGITHM